MADTKLKNANVKLPENLFASEKIYEQAIFDTVLSERASRRQGTHQVKNRAEVSGTGRARQGSLRSPQFVGGGRAFGPQSEKNYSLKVNKKVRFAAFKSALTLLAQDQAVLVDDLKLSKISTKEFITKLDSLVNEKEYRRVLVVTEDETVFKSTANVPYVYTVKANSISVELLLLADLMVISNESLSILEGKFK